MAAFAFQRTGDANYPRTMNILLMGPPKSGKTTFISTMPNVVVADCEAGLMSIAHLNVPYVQVDGTDKLQTLLLILGDEKMRKQQAANMGLPDIESVAIDTTDALQELMKKEILRENRRTQFQRDDWGVLKERMNAVLKAFAALPLNVVFTVHTEVTQDENGKQIYAPGLQGAIKNEIAGLVDFSLMTFRQKETDAQGVSKIVYYLKNEGDDKNPHLGNRAQGRVPEFCEPDFKILHALTFSGINPTVIQEAEELPTVQIQPSVGIPQPVAQSQSQPATPAGAPPVSDADQPINAGGITMLTKEYAAQGLVKPTDLDQWTLGKARSIAKFFTAWKADVAVGKSSKKDLVEFLQACEAYVATVEEVSTPVQKPEEPAATASTEVAQPDPAADTTPTPEPEAPSVPDEHQAAVALVSEQLGGKVIGMEIAEDAKCEVCGNQVDDLDIARLGWGRLQKVLCVSDYKDLIKK